jgi:hypothetical protein
MLSSDGPEGATSPYPTIEDFIEQLKAKHSKKNFDGLLKYCEEAEYEHINELLHLKPDNLMEKAKMSEAAARLVCEKISRAVAKVHATRLGI